MSVTFKDIQTRLSASLDNFFKTLENESQLPPIEIAPLYKIKSAHHELLQAYVYVIKSTTRQPFLLPYFLIRKMNKQNFWKNVLLLLARYNPLRLGPYASSE